MYKLALIAVGSAAGGLCRYGLAGVVQRFAGVTFPWGTLCVNVVGCLLIGVCGAVFSGPHLIREEYRLAATVGLLGGFTTFSSFGFETLQLVNSGSMRSAILNVSACNVLGLGAAWIGYRLVERWLGA